MKVAVFGATGVIGRELVPVLAAEHEVVAVSRRRSKRNEPNVSWVAADATDPFAVSRALDDVEIVYYLVHSLGSKDFEQRDRRAADVMARMAATAEIRQIVYLGGLGDGEADLSPHLRSRRETGERLAAGPVPVTTLRAAMVVGRDSAAFETILALVDRLPGHGVPPVGRHPDATDRAR